MSAALLRNQIEQLEVLQDRFSETTGAPERIGWVLAAIPVVIRVVISLLRRELADAD